jgi:hypothetical protein
VIRARFHASHNYQGTKKTTSDEKWRDFYLNTKDGKVDTTNFLPEKQ